MGTVRHNHLCFSNRVAAITNSSKCHHKFQPNATLPLYQYIWLCRSELPRCGQALSACHLQNGLTLHDHKAHRSMTEAASKQGSKCQPEVMSKNTAVEPSRERHSAVLTSLQTQNPSCLHAHMMEACVCAHVMKSCVCNQCQIDDKQLVEKH